MDENKKRKADAAFFLSLIVSVLALLIKLYLNLANLDSGLYGISAIFGTLAFVSVWKPETFGEIVWQFFESVFEPRKVSSDSHDTQTQKNSTNSPQINADRVGAVNIQYGSPETVSKDTTGIELLLPEIKLLVFLSKKCYEAPYDYVTREDLRNELKVDDMGLHSLVDYLKQRGYVEETTVNNVYSYKITAAGIYTLRQRSRPSK